MTRRDSHDGGRNVHAPLSVSYDVPDADRPRRRVVSVDVSPTTTPANRRNGAYVTDPGHAPGGV